MRNGVCFLVAVLSLFTLTFGLTGCGILRGPHTTYHRGESADLLPTKESVSSRDTFTLPSRKIAKLPEPDLPVNPEVQKQITRFSKPYSTFIDSGLARRTEIDQMLRDIFSDEGVPETLLNVALIESGFRQKAKSPAGAVGMWQFMKATGRMYGLKISLFEDQRQDPVLSTIAAARHLRDLYRMYDCWLLALAAYNGGTAVVNRAIQRAGSTDFWVIARKGYLRRETREYVPRFIAVSLIQKDRDKLTESARAQNLKGAVRASHGT